MDKAEGRSSLEVSLTVSAAGDPKDANRAPRLASWEFAQP